MTSRRLAGLVLGLTVLSALAPATVFAQTDPITYAVESLKGFLAAIASLVVAAAIGWKAIAAWTSNSVEAQIDARRFAMQALVVYGLVMAFNFGLLQGAVEFLVNTMGGRT
ncbi:MAG: hypothetical protein OXQ29_04875 [Rhodospirillaceae bacterium]|nr:hypothetical protein [Rhodospirillaceae bacterium]